MSTHAPSRIIARLDDEHAAMVEYLKKSTGLSSTDLVKRGISRLYEEAQVEPRAAFEILDRNGFIGSGSGPADLSVRVKEEVAEYLAKKHGDR